MPGTGAVLFFLALLVAGLLLERGAQRARIPVGVLLVLLGFTASELATRVAGLDLGVRWHNLGTLITYVIVPGLVFEAALRLDSAALRREWLPVLLLSLPLLLLGAGITAALAVLGIGDRAGFPVTAGLLAGAILCSTEMTGMFRLLLESGAPARVAWILEGESIFNDTAALVLFMLVLAVASMDPAHVTAGGVTWLFLRLLVGGVAAGCVCGLAALWILRRVPGSRSFALLSVACAWGVFLLAQRVLGVSGAMAVLCAGLILSHDVRHADRAGFAHEFWRFVAHTVGALVFILAGVTITVDMFRDQWLAMIIGAAAVLTARTAIVFGVLGPASRLPRQAPLRAGELGLLTWGSVRGSVTLALALSLPLHLDYWYTLQALVYGAVLFSLFVQATTVSRVAAISSAPGSSGAAHSGG